MALLTKTPWFGPKKVRGWGLSPETKFGVYAMYVFIMAIITGVGVLTFGIISVGLYIIAGALIYFVIVLICTSDKPGGPGV